MTEPRPTTEQLTEQLPIERIILNNENVEHVVEKMERMDILLLHRMPYSGCST